MKLMILGGSLLFEILSAWRRLMCVKQVISLAETMKSVFFPRSVHPDDLPVAVDDLHGSLMMIYMEVVHLYDLHGSRLRRLTRKSSVGRFTLKSSMILFRDSGKTLLVLDDFHVSRRTDDFRVSHLEKKVFVLFFNCKTNLRRLTWKSSRSFLYKDKLGLHLIWKNIPTEDFQERLPINLSKSAPDLKNMHIKKNLNDLKTEKMSGRLYRSTFIEHTKYISKWKIRTIWLKTYNEKID
ncbi:hypothetical protein IGI04_030677 [Brassica rapa subsp. trilocularis]|uniref:F-box associated domain-containing protein n=1 Tax=Brassica rapa subsp. trilocularis TaxID=1813537 RepID=A0ABQ7LVF4_BRACM|nr:hypothetical protein IGI04_030677 [Brassica rapa subsp. trilocularis]